MPRPTIVPALAACLALLVSGCGESESPELPEAPESSQTATEQTPASAVLTTLSPKQEQQKQVAIAAKDAMFEKLSGTLMSAIESDGPAQAIDVCKVAAPAIGEQVKRDFGVEIGRTSFKLRNITNAGPDWAASFVEAKTEEPAFVELPDDALGVLLPIMLKQKCTLCHGDHETLQEDVRAALDLHYPNDAATGFRKGDLRGWFWVEVPADAAVNDQASAVSE
jgi:hypothetical protein